MGIQTVPLFAAITRTVPSLFTDAGLFARVILGVLFVMSVISWAIIVDRTRLFLALRARGNALRRAAAKNLAECFGAVDRFMPSVEGAILVEARRYLESRGVRAAPWRLEVATAADADAERSRLRDVLERRALNEIAAMERHLIFLSTTASAAPFLGLLGTVWGIMSSFLSMGAEGAASIEVVGPGIAEALVTTIAGLAAAIPALVGYNMLVRAVHRKETSVDLVISRVTEHAVVWPFGAGAGTDAAGRRAGRPMAR